MRLNTTSEDDPAFVRVATSILDCVVAQCTPQIVVGIQIDNWFDHKWLKFSGKVHGALGIWRKELMIPPFNPNRVKSQTVYRLGERGEYEEIEAPLLHIVQPSSANLNRQLKQATDSGVFAWWTSNTVAHGKGSVMVYTHIGKETSSWFASFERGPEWRISKTKGISVEVIKRFMGCVEQGAATGSDQRLH
jgi:hypothetical protein